MNSWMFFAGLSAVFAALVAIFGKLGLQNINSTVATTLRSLIMSGILLSAGALFGSFKNVKWGAITGKEWTFLFLAALAGALSWLCYFVALKTGDATKVSAIDRMSMVLVVILAAIFLGETLSWKTVLGAVFIVAGAVLITLK